MMIQRILLVIFFAVAVTDAEEGPQPFLLFRLIFPHEGQYLQLLGTLSEKVDFDYSSGSADQLDSLSMHAKLVERTSQGFRFSWTVTQRADGKEVAHFNTTEFLPWGKKKSIKSVPGYYVDVFYSPIPANQLNPFKPNREL